MMIKYLDYKMCITTFVYRFLILLSILKVCQAQARPYWTWPRQGLEANSISLIIYGLKKPSPYQPGRTKFSRIFNQVPIVSLSLISVQNFQNNITIFQEAIRVERRQFQYRLIYNDPTLSINTLIIQYLAVDLNRFSYIYPHTMVVQVPGLASSNNPQLTSQFIPIQYLNPLETNHDYEINVMISGFQCQSNSSFFMSINAIQDDENRYILQVSVKNAKLFRVQIVRVLIDKTIQDQQNLTFHTLSCAGSTIHFHYDNTITYDPYKIPVGISYIFYGIKLFQNNFECSQGGSIFSLKSVEMATSYIVFRQYVCTENFLWQIQTSTCYSQRNLVRMYRIGSQYCSFCFMACYSCTGPLYEDCLEYLPSQAVNNTVNRTIQCKSNFATNPTTGHCVLCSFFVFGCNECLYNGTCLTCKPECDYINETYCNCTTVCPSNFYFLNPHIGRCEPIPQYYKRADGNFIRCPDKCYICSSATLCMVCINEYQLEGDRCVNYIVSSYLMDGNIGAPVSMSRCIHWNGPICAEMCPATSFMFKDFCFDNQCPKSSFPYIQARTRSRMCQPCPATCADCDNHFTCRKCINNLFYLNGTGYCKKCAGGCMVCQSGDCFSCSEGYVYDVQTNTCQDNFTLSQENMTCSVGCAKCVVQQFCQVCDYGYYRYRDEQFCRSCQGVPGFAIKNQLVDGVVVKVCQQTCGDGILATYQCDDGNQLDGDGCNSKCQFQDGYICQQYDSKSYCMPVDFKFTCSYQKSLTQNQIDIILKWQGNVSVSFQYTCQQNLTLLQTTQTLTSITYKFTYPQSASYKTCNFTSNTFLRYSNTISCNITTSPTPTQTIINNTVSSIAIQIFKLIAKPVAIGMWVLGGLGIDPIDILINHGFVYLYLGGLYDFGWNSPGVYGGFQEFCFYGFYCGISLGGDERVAALFQALVKIITLQAIIIVFQQIIVRFLKSSYFSACQIKLFTNIFHNRLTLYFINYTIFLPLTAYYIKTLTTTILNNPTKNYTYQLVIILIHAIYFLFVNLIFVGVVARRTAQIPGHVKYVFFMGLVWMVGIVQGLVIQDQGDKTYKMFLSGFQIIYCFGIYLVLALLDDAPQIRQYILNEIYRQHILRTAITDLGKQAQIYLKISQHQQQKQQIYNNIQILSSWNQLKTILRKINLTLQLGCMGTICVLKYLYFLEGYEICTVFINILFVFGIFCGGLVFNFLGQIVTFVIYVKDDIPSDQLPPKPKPGQIQSQLMNEGTRMNLSMGMSEFSRQQRIKNLKKKGKKV